jgi:hypothetical protein
MTRDDIPMWEDPQESSALRQLLRAGHVENSDYDVERGLARHLAQLQAGTPVPPWAVQTTLQKSAGWSVLAWILPPLISAAVVGAWLAIRPAEPTALAAAAARQSASQEAAAMVAPTPSETPAPVGASLTPATAAVTAMAPTQAPAAAVAPSQDRAERDAADQQSRRDHHAVASARSVRPVARAVSSPSSRRARSSRVDDANATYASTSLGIGIGTASAHGAGTQSSSDGSGTANISGNSSAAVSSKAAPSEELAAKQEPAASPEEQRAKDKETKVKPERRSPSGVDEEKNGDEVSGARLEREMRMLAVAQRVLTDDPERSLRLCRQGESEFHGSMFSAERKQVALLALVQLGRVDQARREGIPFLRAYPNAPWSARLREALGSGRVPSP